MDHWGPSTGTLIRAGRIVARGAPAEVVTEQIMARVFDLSCHVIADPETGSPMVVPRRDARIDAVAP